MTTAGIDDSASLALVEPVFTRLRRAARALGAPPLEERLTLLARLERGIVEAQDVLADAISGDFGHRSKDETLIAEVFAVLSAIRHARAHLADWMAAEPRETHWAFMPSSAQVVFQPLGVVGIIAPWNYPLQLALSPLVSALAAGNRAMVKPSELTPRTAQTLSRLVSQVLPDDHAAVVCGGPEVGHALARLPLDHLVFTGSREVGMQVMRAASENLVPVTLELGGKCPAIVGVEARVRSAAGRIIEGKAFNAGQTCVAPDYALIPHGTRDAFVDGCRAAVAKRYPTLAKNPDYTSIASPGRYDALRALVADARERGATVIELNPANESLEETQRKIAPTLLLDVTGDMLCMKREVFGPVLPVIPYERFADAIARVNEHGRPLALYYFGHDDAAIEHLLCATTSGGVTVNETMLHVLQDDLPFGGVGASGMGRYHGRDGFEALSLKKAVFKHSPLSGTRLFKPPYGWRSRRLLRLLVGG